LEGRRQQWTIRRRKKKKSDGGDAVKRERAKRRLECVKLVAGVAGAPLYWPVGHGLQGQTDIQHY
jgi:hypothetical protein